MSHPPHYFNSAYHEEENSNNPSEDELENGRIDGADVEDEVGEESTSEEEEEEGLAADVDVQVVVVSPGVLNGTTAREEGHSDAAERVNGKDKEAAKKKVALKSLVIPDHILHKKYEAPCHALCTVKSPSQFITCVAIVFYIHGLFTEYSHHAIIGTANRYPFSQMELRFMNGLEHTGIVVGVVFMSFFSNRFNRPVAISVGAFICAVGSIFCAIPYFAEGEMDNVSFREISLFLRGATCQKYNLSFAYQGTCNLVANVKYSDTLAFSLICLGQFVVGLGASLYVTNSLVHIEESVSLKDSTVCLGVCLSFHGLGMFCGSLLSTGLSSLPEGITGGLPLVGFRERVSPWWLGFCIASGLFFIAGFLFFCFPRWFIEPDWLLRRRERYYKKLVLRKKQADRQKKKLLSRKLKAQEKKSESNGKTSTKPNSKSAKTPQKTAKNKQSNQRKPTQGADIIRVPSPADRNPTFGEIVSGSHPADLGTINSAFVVEAQDPMSLSDGVQSSNAGVYFKADKNPKSKKHSSKNGKVNDSTVQENSDGTEVGTKTLNYIKKNRKSKVTKKYLMRREQFKDISRHIWRLLRNKPLALCFCGSVLCSYTITGYTAVLTPYLKARFYQNQYSAEFATAFITPLGFCVGTFFGSLIVGGNKKLRENLHLSSRLIVGTLPITIICMIALMFLSCDMKDHTASILKYPKNWTCHDQCDCTDTLQDPVCGDDGYIYPSACLAGCHYIDSNPDPLKYTFSTCECIDTPPHTASYGLCSHQCVQFYIYIVVAAVAMVAFFMGQVPVLMVFLRAVRDRYRSLSLGFGVWLVYILGYIMGPVIFHEIVASQCQYSTENCQKEATCWYYDLPTLGLMLHGIVAIFLVAGTLLFIVMSILLLPGRFVNPAEESNKLALERVGKSHC